MIQLSAGKFRGLQRLSDDRGLFKMVAIDQRNPVIDPIKRIRRTDDVPYDDIVAVKDLLAKFLAPASSAMLLDPIFSFPQALPQVGSRPGLILAYEDANYEQGADGIKSAAIPGWSILKTRLAGADAAKLLVWYRADAPDHIKGHQQALVRETGIECRQSDLIFLVEILIYRLPGEDANFVEENRPRLVHEAVADFLDPAFNIDLYKLESPCRLVGVADPDGPQALATQMLFDQLVEKLPRPWVLLSAGAQPDDFRRSLVFAYRAGASGYLCGRAIWGGAFGRFPDTDAMSKELQSESRPYLDSINNLTDKMATPWYRHPSWRGEISIEDLGLAF